MACTGLQSITYYSYDGTEGVAIDVPRNDAYIADMIEKERAFWTLVNKKIPPEVTDSDYTDRNDTEWVDLAQQIMDIDSRIEDLSSQKEVLRTHLIEISGDVSCRGAGIILIKSLRRGNVDYAKIPQLKDVDIEQYRKPSTESWTLRIAQNRIPV
jgi:hypothetical protein